MIKTLFILFCVFFLLTTNSLANNTVELSPVEINLHDQASLQRGAKFFMNYCSGCHSLRYMRYNRMAEDLGLTTFEGDIDENLLFSNLIFTQAKIHDPIEISLPPADARQWFGTLPPDLSLIARKRGSSWLYTYLKSFYVDKSRPFGSNNLLVPEVAMPDVLAPLAGRVVAIGNQNKSFPPSLVQVEPGEMSEQEFDNALQDLVTFLVYVGEPGKMTRYRMGGFVMVFLCILLLVVYQLKKAYWKTLYIKNRVN